MRTLDALLLLCALGSGLMAGLFLVFSVAVMKALGALPAPCGIAAMQSINRVIVNPVFLAVFMGTGALSLAVAVLAWPAPWAVAGALLYLVGSIVVTMRCNVPRNNALDRATPDSVQGRALWRDYLVTWTAWNHVRTLACAAALVCFAIAFKGAST
jgi:uncharacterized membrane protein